MRFRDWFKPDPRYQQRFDGLAREHFSNHRLEITWRVLAIVSEQLGAVPEQLRPATQFVRDLKADDLDPVELIAAIEQEFGFKIPRQDAEGMVSLEDLVEYVERRNVKPSAGGNAATPHASA